MSFSAFVLKVVQFPNLPWLWRLPTSMPVSVTEDCPPGSCGFNVTSSLTHRFLCQSYFFYNSNTSCALRTILLPKDRKPLAAVHVPPRLCRLAIWYKIGIHHFRCLQDSVDGLWCNVRKFVGSQLRSTKLSECYRVPVLADPSSKLSYCYSAVPYPDGLDAEEELASAPASQSPPPVSSLTPDLFSAPPVPSHVTEELSAPPVPRADTCPAPSPVPDVHANTPDPQVTTADSEPFVDTTDSEPLPADSEPFVSPGSRQPGRPSRRPAYLEDYVT